MNKRVNEDRPEAEKVHWSDVVIFVLLVVFLALAAPQIRAYASYGW